MSLPSLYNLTEDFRKLMDCEDDEELNNALINIVAGEIEKKAENYCQFLATLSTTVEQFKSEEKRIANARKAMENKVEAVRNRMKECLLAANIDKLQAGTFKISVSLSPGTIEIEDIRQIPAKFLTIVPEHHTPDKAKIKEAIKRGEDVPGAKLEAGFTMRIV